MKSFITTIARRGRGRRAVAATCAATVLLGGTTATTLSGCRGGRFNAFSLSKSQEVDLGQQAAVDIDRREKVVNSGPQFERLQRVAARVLPLAQRDYDVPYSVKLIDSKEINAFALPGGPIYFYRGLMELAETDDEIAAVLGHEAAHVVKRHSVKQISDAQTKGLLASLFLGRAGDLAQIAAGLALQIDQLRFSRGDESESDRVGFQYLVEAGYDPYAMASMFRRMDEKAGGKGGGPEWLRSHPVTSKRVQDATVRADEYVRERGGTPRGNATPGGAAASRGTTGG
jgi:predicted Zn-dependent protease